MPPPYYRYVSLDLGQLWENLGGDDLERAVDGFTRALYLAVPAARQSTQSGACPWDYARILVRRGQRMQLSFETPVHMAQGGGWLAPSMEALDAGTGPAGGACRFPLRPDCRSHLRRRGGRLHRRRCATCCARPSPASWSPRHERPAPLAGRAPAILGSGFPATATGRRSPFPTRRSGVLGLLCCAAGRGRGAAGMAGAHGGLYAGRPCGPMPGSRAAGQNRPRCWWTSRWWAAATKINDTWQNLLIPKKKRR